MSVQRGDAPPQEYMLEQRLLRAVAPRQPADPATSRAKRSGAGLDVPGCPRVGRGPLQTHVRAEPEHKGKRGRPGPRCSAEETQCA